MIFWEGFSIEKPHPIDLDGLEEGLLKCFFSVAALAFLTATKDFMSMPNGSKVQRFTGSLLDALDIRPLHFTNSTALHTDQVVMVRTLMFNLELGKTARGTHPLGQTAFFEHLQRSEYGHLANALTLERLVDLLLRHVLFGF